MSDLSDLKRGLNSDKPGRRYYSANNSVKSFHETEINPPNYNKGHQEEISYPFEQNLICGTAIPINLSGLPERFSHRVLLENKLAQEVLEQMSEAPSYHPPIEIKKLLEDSGMHIVDLEEDASNLGMNYHLE